VCASGTLSRPEAERLMTALARAIVAELAGGDGASDVARTYARRVLADDARGTVDRVAGKLMLLADADADGRVNLAELAGLFDAVQRAPSGAAPFPQPLRALAGSLQLLPPGSGRQAAAAAARAAEWHVGVPGDDHTLRTVALGSGVSVVGLGRSADASAYYLPELGLCFDAGIAVKSIKPKTVLLTHGHRDHTAALPTLARGARVYAPRDIAPMVTKFLLAEAQLNFGDASQTDAATEAALGAFDVQPVDDGDAIALERDRYAGSPTPLGVEAFEAPHKDGVPAVAYGVYRRKTRLCAEFSRLPKSELGALLRDDVVITEPYDEGVVFFSGDTRIDLLRERHAEILPKYSRVIHEVTFLGPPSIELEESTRRKGHTHYAQLHPFVLAFPETTFVCVHWSLRYSRSDVLAFFEDQYGGVPNNVVLWI